MESFEETLIDLYLNQKLSVMQIAKVSGISTSSITRILDSKGIKRRTVSEAIRCLNITKFGKREFVIKKDLSHEDELLKVSGVMLYWGEGAKQGNKVALANSDPELIRVFTAFLRRICGVDDTRLRVAVHYYEDHNLESLIPFWSGVTGIPCAQFHKGYLHKRRESGTYRKPSLYGTVIVCYSDSKLLATILGWMETYSMTIVRKEHPAS